MQPEELRQAEGRLDGDDDEDDGPLIEGTVVEVFENV
jgi:hypothetical protein